MASDAYAVPWDGGRYHYLCEKGHHITSRQRDIGPSCPALASPLPGDSRPPCGAEIEWRHIPYVPGEVEVWPAGDRTSPTRDFHATYDSVARILYEVIPNDVKTGLLDEAAMKVTRLLHGQGDETDA